MLYGAGGAGLLAERGGGLLLLSLPYGNRRALAAWPLLGEPTLHLGEMSFLWWALLGFTVLGL